MLCNYKQRMHIVNVYSAFCCTGMHTTWDCVFVLTVLIEQNSFTHSSQLTKPINTISFVGDTVKMECSNNSSMAPIDWEFTLAGFNNESFIYSAGRITEKLSSRYWIETDSKSRYDIVIDSVDLSHAGTYRCMPNTKEVINTSSYTAQLIVLGK